MDNYRDQIKNLAFMVNDGLTAYITVHDKIFKEAATFKSLLKNIFGRAVPMSQLLQDAEKLITMWDNITKNIKSFRDSSYSSMGENERQYFDILNRYAKAVGETIYALVERQRLLNERSKGDQDNTVSWNIYQNAERKYSSLIEKYMAIGQELNNVGYLIFSK